MLQPISLLSCAASRQPSFALPAWLEPAGLWRQLAGGPEPRRGDIRWRMLSPASARQMFEKDEGPVGGMAAPVEVAGADVAAAAGGDGAPAPLLTSGLPA